MKRRSSANQQAAGVPLFPFLAVLLCAIGGTIIVLVVIARHTRVKVAAEAEEAGDLVAQREELEWKIDELKKSREATQKLLADKQTELSHLEEHARRLKGQLDEAAAAREHFSGLAAGDARENEDLKKRLARVRIDADRTRAEIEELKRKGGPGESYAIIPYRGPNETRRRPIYIECRRGVIVLQPEGVELPIDEDFTFDLGPSNLLASTLRAVAEYHRRSDLAGKGGGGTPYPLFIIRPDGIESWLRANMAVSSWGSDFGYELVGQDWKFDFPPPDARLQLAMRQAIAEAKARQAMIARAAPRLSRSAGHAVFRASRGGGIVQVDGFSGGGGRRGRGRPGLGSRRAGRREGPGNGDSFGGDDGIGPQGTPPRLLATSPQHMGDGPVHSIDGDDNPYASALEGTGTGNGNVQPGVVGSGGPGIVPGGPGVVPGVGGTGGRYAPGAGGAGGAPGLGLAGTGYSPGGPGGQPGSGLGQGQGRGQNPGLGSGQRGGYGQQPGAGLGQQPGSGLAQPGPRGGAGKQGAPSGSASGDMLAMGGPAGGSPYSGGSRYGNGGNGNGGNGNAQPGGGDKPDQGGMSPDGTQPGKELGGTQPRGQATGGKVPGARGPGGQAPGEGTYGKPLAGPNHPAGGGNAQQVGGQPAPGTGPPGNARARANGTGKGRYSSGPTGSGTSDPNATGDQGQGTAGGPNVAASPNGLAGAKVVDNGSTTSESAAGPSTRDGGVGGQSDSGSPTNSAGGAQQPGGRGSMSRMGNGGGANTKPIGQQFASGSQSSSAGSGGQSSSGSGGQSSATSGQPASAMGSGSSSVMQSMQGGMPSPNLNFGQQDQQASQSNHRKQREKNWANPDASTSNVPIQRPIRIVCDSDHLTLLAEGRGKQGMRVIPLKPQTSDSIEDLVGSVWDRIDSWGTAGRNMYWRPTLMMEVEPGAERRYAELQALLADSGFDVHGKPRSRVLADPRPAGKMR